MNDRCCGRSSYGRLKSPLHLGPNPRPAQARRAQLPGRIRLPLQHKSS